jgi:hypothetical protein
MNNTDKAIAMETRLANRRAQLYDCKCSTCGAPTSDDFDCGPCQIAAIDPVVLAGIIARQDARKAAANAAYTAEAAKYPSINLFDLLND